MSKTLQRIAPFFGMLAFCCYALWAHVCAQKMASIIYLKNDSLHVARAQVTDLHDNNATLKNNQWNNTARIDSLWAETYRNRDMLLRLQYVYAKQLSQ